MSAKIPSPGSPREKEEVKVTIQPAPTVNLLDSRTMSILPTFQRTQQAITCHDNLGRPKSHGTEQRYLSPTTGACRKLIVQAVRPVAPHERGVGDHMTKVNKLGLWLAYTNPFRDGMLLTWIGTWVYLTFKLLWSLLWIFVQVWIDFPDGVEYETEVYNTGYYKPYIRPFTSQLWEARSRKEFSSRSRETIDGEDVRLHTSHPRVLMLYDSTHDQWFPCQDRNTIIRTKYLAISYCAGDMYGKLDSDATPEIVEEVEREKEEFKNEVRAAVMRQNFGAYWLDLECLSGDEKKKRKLDLFCMSDVYRQAEKTLVVLGDYKKSGLTTTAWERWGNRVWTFPEALLSRHLCWMFRGHTKIESVSLHQLASLSHPKRKKEQAIINAYSGKDPLERLERLSLLKEAIFRRDLTEFKEKKPDAPGPVPGPPTSSNSKVEETPQEDGSKAKNSGRVYALMGFFEHRIEPDYDEMEMCALARLSMANDSDRIAERMVSLLPSPSEAKKEVGWYAEEDMYQANLWDVLPEVQVAGVTEGGALVLDGCKAACIRWKDFPEVAVAKTISVRRAVVGSLPYLAWPAIIGGIVIRQAAFSTPSDAVGGALLVVCGIIVLLVSPRLFVFGEQGRAVYAQPWLVGVKGVLSADEAALRMFPGGNKGPHCNIAYTPSGSPFAIPEEGATRAGSKSQYDLALRAERGEYAGRMYTLVDTWSATIYYFTAEKPPTVCLFTGREGGMGRFVLCSEKCDINELHKETVLRMPTLISQRMELTGWVAVK